MTYSTTGGVPTRGDAYAKLIHHLEEAQSQAALLAHLHRAEDSTLDETLAHGWLGVSELIRKMRWNIVQMAKRRLQ